MLDHFHTTNELQHIVFGKVIRLLAKHGLSPVDLICAIVVFRLSKIRWDHNLVLRGYGGDFIMSLVRIATVEDTNDFYSTHFSWLVGPWVSYQMATAGMISEGGG